VGGNDLRYEPRTHEATRDRQFRCTFFQEGREHQGNILRAATRLANDHTLRPLLDPQRLGLADALDAYALTGQRKARGKLVVEIN
jgi:NADPH:quinone reductase-like Zn-dependent oxidoreductase